MPVAIKCHECGAKFERSKSQIKERNFCSTECVNEWQSAYHSGEGNPNYSGGKISIDCEQCGDATKIVPSRKKNRKNIFCSQECVNEWKSENKRGKNHPNWKGGYPKYRGKNWNKKRRKTLNRDNGQCRFCMISEEALDESLHVHHIIPISSYDNRENANHLDNLISLCPMHHYMIEHDKISFNDSESYDGFLERYTDEVMIKNHINNLVQEENRSLKIGLMEELPRRVAEDILKENSEEIARSDMIINMNLFRSRVASKCVPILKNKITEQAAAS